MRILTFGEFLYDCFDDGKVPGGAPFNLAVHLARLGAEVDFCTSVGKDADGDAALALMKKEGIGTDFCSRSELPTGRSFVRLTDGQPQYHLQYPAAWDKILLPEIQGKYDAFCFGTQAQRSDVSMRSLHLLLEKHPAKEVYLDLNLRGRYQNPDVLRYSIGQTTILKLSREEASQLSIIALPYHDGRREDFLRSVSEAFPNLKLILLTLDREGALLFRCSDGSVTVSPKPQAEVVSAVGAGDSFSAAFLRAYLSGESPEVCLKQGVLLADYVVTQIGAVPDYPEELRRALGIGSV